jgi:hypothetical protein
MPEYARTPVAIITGDYFLEDEIRGQLDALGAVLQFKPVWNDELVRLAHSLCKAA